MNKLPVINQEANIPTIMALMNTFDRYRFREHVFFRGISPHGHTEVWRSESKVEAKVERHETQMKAE